MLRNDSKFKNLVKGGARFINGTPQIKKVVVQGQEVELNVDEKMIKDMCELTFGTTENPKNPKIGNNIELFNEFLASTVEEIVAPKVNSMLSLIADFHKCSAGTVYKVNFKKTTYPKWLYTAKGTSVDLTRLGGEVTSKIAEPESLTYGGYYECTTFRSNPIEAFNDAVSDLANRKLELYFDLILKAFEKAIASGNIPANNCAIGDNLELTDFQKAENTMIRLTGGRPLFFADTALIDHFANLIPTAQKELLTDDVKKMLREDLNPRMISKSTAFAFPNQWLDEQNSKVRFKPSLGFIFPGGGTGRNSKPFAITEFGAVRQFSEFDNQTERVKLKIVFEANIMLYNARYIGAIKDDSVSVTE